MTLVLTFYKANFFIDFSRRGSIISLLMIIINMHELVINHIHGIPVPFEPKGEIVNQFKNVNFGILHIIEYKTLAYIVVVEVNYFDH